MTWQTTFPSDDILIARGKYSTLGKERRLQLERMQDICSTIVTAAHSALRDSEMMPPASMTPVDTVEKCLANMKEARERIVQLSNGMIELKPLAWQAEASRQKSV
jgi:hypothetical protein